MNAAKRLTAFLKKNGTVHCSPGGKGYRIEGSAGGACGITKLLGDTFYPNYHYTGKCKQRYDYVTGAKRGTLVDSQVRDIVRRIFDPDAERKHTRIHPYTRKIMSSLTLLNLTPAFAQCYVGDASLLIATGVDLVCVDNVSKRPVLIELKMGFNGTLDESNANMISVLSAYPNSPRYQHQAQLAVTYELFKRTFGVDPIRALILNANDNGVNYHELEPVFRRLAPTILSEISRTKEKKKSGIKKS